MEALQRPTLRIGQPSPAQISFGQFGNPNLARMLNLNAGLGTPPLPLSPAELDGLGPHEERLRLPFDLQGGRRRSPLDVLDAPEFFHFF